MSKKKTVMLSQNEINMIASLLNESREKHRKILRKLGAATKTRPDVCNKKASHINN